jgi:ribose/xylose/arabinose/galactoside ABC-type transport system permease subunit
LAFNGLALMNQSAAVSEMVEGIVLLIAVSVDALVRRAQQRTGRSALIWDNNLYSLARGQSD